MIHIVSVDKDVLERLSALLIHSNTIGRRDEFSLLYTSEIYPHTFASNS
jgi:hypothetical protein